MGDVRPFSAIAEDSELNLLCRLHAMLDSDGIPNRDAFSDLMRVAFGVCRLEPRRLSDDLGFSFSTVYRWIEGRTAPHPSLWPVISGWVGTALKGRVDALVPQEPVV